MQSAMRALALLLALGCAGAALVAPAPVASAKDELLSLLIGGLRPADATLTNSVNECLTRLEASNPTPRPARDALLNGVWQLEYAGTPAAGLIDSPTREIALALYSSGYSAGPLLQLINKLPAPIASSVTLKPPVVTIASDAKGQPRVSATASADVFGSELSVTATSNLLPASDVRLREELVEAQASPPPWPAAAAGTKSATRARAPLRAAPAHARAAPRAARPSASARCCPARSRARATCS